MIKARAWPAKAMYILIAAALAISLLIMVAPAQKASAQDGIPDAEWERVSTPTTKGYVLAPDSYIIDFAVGDDGEVAYVIVEITGRSTHLLRSDDYAATWEDDIDDALYDELEDDFGTEPDYDLWRVACDPEDSDFVAVVVDADGGSVHVYVSRDGGATFKDTGEVEDGDMFPDGSYVTDLAVSPEDDDEREIAVVGSNTTDALIFRCTAVGEFSTGWEDARYDGWDDDPNFEMTHNSTSLVVTDVKFAPSWLVDKTILVTTVVDVDGGTVDADDYFSVYLQTGTWGTTEGWNEQSTVSTPQVLIANSVRIPVCLAMVPGYGMQDFRGIAGLTLPLDYAGRYTNKRYAWVWVNWYYGTDPAATIFKVKNDDADPVGPMGQIEDGEVWLTNVDYLGYISEGKAIAGVMGTGGYAYSASCMGNYNQLFTDCCEGVQVYHNDGIVNMDICCEPWDEACKPPTGTKAMAVQYASDDPATSKAYAIALWAYQPWNNAEGAWSVSFDDGDVWNQLSLIDTEIDYLSDVAVSPDCNKTMLVSINDCDESSSRCCCDSVWQHAENLPEAEEYSGKWLRTWCGNLEGDWGFLRLAPEETTGDTVYLVDELTDTVYWNELETLGCWEDGTATVDEISDLAVKDRETIYAVDIDGTVAMSDDFALGWHKPVDSELEEGYTIAVWGDHILVGGAYGDVSYSDDGGETFTELEDIADSGYVTVAFDSYFDTNNTIYAAVAWADDSDDNGVYSFVIDESEKWKDLNAEPSREALCCVEDTPSIEVHFTGLVVDNAEGNPMTSADTGGVIYASFYYDDGNGYCGDLTGVARRLNPAEETVCPTCVEWDYLIEGLTDYTCGPNNCPDIEERFDAIPDPLKICGCLTPDSNSKLFAIDSTDYDMYHKYFEEDGDSEGQDGTVWMFEDCYAKKAPDLISPSDGETLPSDPCDCIPLPFTMRWDRLCDACSYDIQIALDEDFNEVILDSRWMCDWGVEYCCHYYPPEGETPSAYFMEIWGEYRVLLCEYTYYWRVRAADAATDQIIHSWWSEPNSFTVAPGPGTGVDLTSPENGATGVAINDIGFTWSSVSSADEYDWVLSANSDLTSPIATVEGLTNTAGAYSGTDLDYETPYFWQVTALKEGVVISTSEVGTFTTIAETVVPPPPEEPTTPTWVWVVIAIGAVLVIVVIVLIFRTRRV